jgi:hypothetical protein
LEHVFDGKPWFGVADGLDAVGHELVNVEHVAPPGGWIGDGQQ